MSHRVPLPAGEGLSAPERQRGFWRERERAYGAKQVAPYTPTPLPRERGLRRAAPTVPEQIGLTRAAGSPGLRREGAACRRMTTTFDHFDIHQIVLDITLMVS